MSELVYTSSSMLKMVFRSGERSLSRQEVENRLQNTYSTSLMKMNVLPGRVIEEAMAGEQSPFHIGGSHAVIEMETAVRDHIAEELVRYLLENKGPLTTEQCLKKLRRHNVVSYSYAQNKLPLYKDPRFVQFHGSDLWYLSRWHIANDRMYSVLVEKGLKQIPLSQLYIILEHELSMSRREYAFAPEGDSRFKVIDGLVLVAYEEQLPELKQSPVQLNEEENQTEQSNLGKEEVAVTMANELKTASVLEDVLRNVQDSTEKLEQRIREMEEEVLEHFKENDMTAISKLVQEKEKGESIVAALSKVAELVNQ
jgi:hypothetical protein